VRCAAPEMTQHLRGDIADGSAAKKYVLRATCYGLRGEEVHGAVDEVRSADLTYTPPLWRLSVPSLLVSLKR
jgi:hypothetical protein